MRMTINVFAKYQRERSSMVHLLMICHIWMTSKSKFYSTFFLLQGANFRDLPGVLVGPDNIVEWDPKVERVLLPSGKPLVWKYVFRKIFRSRWYILKLYWSLSQVPDYAMSFIKGKSSKYGISIFLISLNFKTNFLSCSTGLLGGYGGMKQFRQSLQGLSPTIRYPFNLLAQWFFFMLIIEFPFILGDSSSGARQSAYNSWEREIARFSWLLQTHRACERKVNASFLGFILLFFLIKRTHFTDVPMPNKILH